MIIQNDQWKWDVGIKQNRTKHVRNMGKENLEKEVTGVEE